MPEFRGSADGPGPQKTASAARFTTPVGVLFVAPSPRRKKLETRRVPGDWLAVYQLDISNAWLRCLRAGISPRILGSG
jgi:hypothetical protein